MNDSSKARIENLLEELRAEIGRGILKRELGEEIAFRFIVPVSNEIEDGVVVGEFRTRPMPRKAAFESADGPRLPPAPLDLSNCTIESTKAHFAEKLRRA